MTQAPTPPFIGTRNYYAGGNLAIRFIVIHATVSPTKCGGATDIALYFQHAETSAHYVVDPCQVRQCVHDWDRAWHCGSPGNDHSLGVELTDPQTGPDSRWHDDDHETMLRRAAGLVSQLCEAYDVPKRKLTPHQLAAGDKGIVGHADVTKGLGGTTHTDPGGGFPWGHFMDLVRGEEDDVALSNDDIERIAERTADKVLQRTVGNPAKVTDGKEVEQQIQTFIRYQPWRSERVESRVIAVAKAVDAMAGTLPAEVTKAVRDALVDAVVDVDVHVSGADVEPKTS